MARIARAARQDVQRRLLEAAADHFARHGFERANVNAISLSAGFAKGTVYNYFESKEALFRAVLADAARRAVARYARARHADTARASLRALAAADVAVLREEEAFMKVLIREAMSFRPATWPLVIEGLAPFLDAVRSVLERGAERGEIRTDRPPEQLALLFVGILALLYVQHWGSGGAWPALDEVPDLAVEAFLDGAAVHGRAASAHPPKTAGRSVRGRPAPSRSARGGSSRRREDPSRAGHEPPEEAP